MIIIFLLLVFLYPEKKKEEINQETRAVFISYIELEEYIKKEDQTLSQRNIDKMIENIKENHLNTIILQVRPSSDAIYHSKIYPTSKYIVKEEGEAFYDVLDYFIKKAHQKNIKLIAWINPYRIRTTEEIESISKKNPAYFYLNTDTIYIKNGVFYNPSKEEVTNLIIEGVKELLEYEIDGLLMDDYFYPDDEIDQKDYEEYIKNNSYLTKEEYHLQIINQMIEKVHKECQKKEVKFGISPDGNIENNYQKHYADVRKWLNSNQYIDFIMPQIYYGFYNSTKDYTKVIKEWESLIKEDSIEFFIALAYYKIGLEDQYAKAGKEEWIQNNNIIMKEVILSRNRKNYKGFALFRYDSIFSRTDCPNCIQELENLKKIIK